jgi:hypothetical protein
VAAIVSGVLSLLLPDGDDRPPTVRRGRSGASPGRPRL